MNESTATRHQRQRRAAQVVNLSIGAAWLLVVVGTPLGRWSADRAAALGAPWSSLVFVAGLALVWEAIALPAAVQAAARAERRLRRGLPQDVAVQAHVRGALAGALLTVAGALVVRAAMVTLGAWWWVAIGLAGAPALVAATALAGLTARTAAGSRPLSRPALAARLSALAERACGRAVPVREWTDPAVDGPTAVVTGIGRSGAILLSRDMAADWSDDEIAVVVAHELSHHARHDLWRKAGLDAAALLAAAGTAQAAIQGLGPRLGVLGPADLLALPLAGLAAWVAWWGLRPIRLAQSRAHERVADRFAIALTGQPEAFRTAVRRLAARHLAEERPSALTRWFFHRHPTVEERLNAAAK